MFLHPGCSSLVASFAWFQHHTSHNKSYSWLCHSHWRRKSWSSFPWRTWRGVNRDTGMESFHFGQIGEEVIQRSQGIFYVLSWLYTLVTGKTGFSSDLGSSSLQFCPFPCPWHVEAITRLGSTGTTLFSSLLRQRSVEAGNEQKPDAKVGALCFTCRGQLMPLIVSCSSATNFV